MNAKYKPTLILVITFVLIAMPFGTTYSYVSKNTAPLVIKERSNSNKTPLVTNSSNINYSTTSCTVFTVEVGETILFGNNEDEAGSRLYTEIQFEPSSNENNYGSAYLGFNDNPPGGDDIDGLAIGGINTQGLCFDANGVGLAYVTPDPSKGGARSFISYWKTILRECASVEEVIQWHETHNMGGWWGNQLHWADSTGDAVVISAVSGGLAYTRKNSSYLVSTNFNLANKSNGWYPCTRYSTVTNLLEFYILQDTISFTKVRDLLEAVHLPASSSYIGTVYSNIFDLQTQDIYLYIHGNYRIPVKFNLNEELANGYHVYKIDELNLERPEMAGIIELALIPFTIAIIIAYTVWFVHNRKSKLKN